MKNYSYSISKAMGKSLQEKYDVLFRLMFEANKEDEIKFIICGADLMSIFETRTGFKYIENPKNIGHLTHVGDYLKEGFSFQCFKSNVCAKDELMLFGRNNALIKFSDYNFVKEKETKRNR